MGGVVLEEGDEEKLQYLTFAMAASKTFGKSTYATWLIHFDEGEGSQSGWCWRHCSRIGCHGICFPASQKMVVCLCICSVHSSYKRGEVDRRAYLLGSLFVRVDECVGNIVH